MTQNPLRSHSRVAFTLVEVLATLVLAAVILPVAMRGISLALTAAGESRHRMEAASLAQNKLADLIATGEWQSADLSGDFGEDRPGYRWQADVSDWDGTTLRQISVSVNWTSAGRERDVALTTLVYEGGT